MQSSSACAAVHRFPRQVYSFQFNLAEPCPASQEREDEYPNSVVVRGRSVCVQA